MIVCSVMKKNAAFLKQRVYNSDHDKKLVILLLLPVLSLAHPHLFIDTKLNFTIRNNKIDTLHVSWVFDDMNSQILMMDYDTNRDKKLNKKETQKFKKIYFDALSKKKPFVHIKVDGKKIALAKTMSAFSMKYKKNLLTLNFTIDFKKIKQKKIIDIGFWDETNYTAFSMEPEYIKFKGKTLKTELDFYEADLFVADVLKVTL